MNARSLSMGGAYTALADDADGALVNPAGLSTIEGRQITATVAALYMGLSDDSLISQNILGYAYRQEGIGSLGIVWKRLGAGGLYSENIFAFSFARSFGLYLSRKKEERKNNAAIGTALKLMGWDSAPTVGSDGRVIEDLPGWQGFTFDIGFMIWPAENISVAVALQNLNKPNIVSSELSNVVNELPSIARMGVAAKSEKVTWAMDLLLRQGLVDLRLGVEMLTYNGQFPLRMGFSLENLAWGANLTLGAGYRPTDALGIDYAFAYPINTISNTLGSHRISVVYNF